MLEPQETRWWIEALAYAALAALGGLLGYIMRAIDNKEKINKARAFLEAMAAGFVGLLMMLTCSAFHLSREWSGVIVGLCGWLGAQATIRILEQLVYKKLGVTKP